MLPRPLLNPRKVPTHMRRARVRHRSLALGIPRPVNGADVCGAGEGLADRVYAVLCVWWELALYVCVCVCVCVEAFFWGTMEPG